MLLCLYGFLVNFLLIPYTVLLIVFKITSRRCTSKVCLIGKTAIVTGGNRGIGLHTVLDLASRGCRVIIACRSNADDIRDYIIAQTNNSNIVVKQLDLMSLESVRTFSKNINETEERLDILINNAGIAAATNQYTQDNLHPVMQTNYFGPFLLTHLLLDLLKKTHGSRIIFLTSFMFALHNLTTNNLNFPEDTPVSFINGVRIYSNSKLCNLIITFIFAEKLKPFGISSIAVHPGLVYTDIFKATKNINVSERIITWCYTFWKFIIKTPEEGAQPTLKAAISNNFKNVTGKFIWDFNWGPIPAAAKDKEFCKKIWKATENYVKLTPNEKI